MDSEFLKQWRASGRQELLAKVAPSTINDEQRTVDVIWFSGADVDRNSWSEGPYILRFDPKGADLSLLNNGAPVCDCHTMYEVEDQLGRVDRAWIDGSDYKATLRFKRSTELTGPRPELDGLWQDIKDGIVSKFSMGTEILEFIDQRDKNGQLEVRTAKLWRPYEISIAPIPADYDTCTLSGQNRPAPGQALQSAVIDAAHRARQISILRLR
jgi:hypothetical protein